MSRVAPVRFRTRCRPACFMRLSDRTVGTRIGIGSQGDADGAVRSEEGEPDDAIGVHEVAPAVNRVTW